MIAIMRLDVSPNLSADNPLHGALGHTEEATYCGLRPFAIGVHAADFDDHVFGQFCAWVSGSNRERLAFRHPSASCPSGHAFRMVPGVVVVARGHPLASFSDHVSNIGEVAYRLEQMPDARVLDTFDKVNTTVVIPDAGAGVARVPDDLIVSQRFSGSLFPRGTVSHLLAPSRPPNQRVTCSVRAIPDPAVTRLVNISPQLCGQRSPAAVAGTVALVKRGGSFNSLEDRATSTADMRRDTLTWHRLTPKQSRGVCPGRVNYGSGHRCNCTISRAFSSSEEVA